MKKNIALLLLSVSAITQLTLTIDIREIRNDSGRAYRVGERTINANSTIAANITIPVAIETNLNERGPRSSAFIFVGPMQSESKKNSMMPGRPSPNYEIFMNPRTNSIVKTRGNASTGYWRIVAEYNFANNAVRLILPGITFEEMPVQD